MSSVFEGDAFSKSYTKLAKFSGKKKHYALWSKKAQGFFVTIGCRSLMTVVPGMPSKLLTASERAKLALAIEIEKDDKKKAEMKLVLTYCQMSDKAFGHLVNCIDISGEEGEHVYDRLTAFQDEDYPR
jgi:hypothetical protein